MPSGLRVGPRTLSPVFATTLSRRSPGSRPNRSKRLPGSLWESRPVSYFAWAGVEQHTNTTQIARALGLLYALTGSFGGKGGNVQFASVANSECRR